jgi:transcriptional regulator with XRE-family HTH domain
VIGANCRRIRTDNHVTQAQLASHARRVGLPWTGSKVGDIESGRHAVPFAMVLALVLALDNASGQGRPMRGRPRVTLADLVQSDGYVAVNDDLTPTGEALASVCSGKPWELRGGIDTADDVAELLDPAPGVLGERYGMQVGQVADMRKRSGLAEMRLADRLGVTADHLLGLAWKLWKRPYSEERDRRVEALRASRRLVGQALITELQAELWKEQQYGDH